MKTILVTSLMMLISLAAQAEMNPVYSCVSPKKNSEITRVMILRSGAPNWDEVMEIYDANGLVYKTGVTYGDDMTYIVYYSKTEELSLMLDYPSRNNQTLGLFEWTRSSGQKYRINYMDCVEY